MKTKLATTVLAFVMASSAAPVFANYSFNGVYLGANVGAFTKLVWYNK